MNARFEFIFSPGSLDGLPAIYYGSVRVKPRDVAAVQRAVYEKMPTITVINMADVLEIVQQVVDQIALVVRFVSAFTIVAGAIILASSVAGTRFGRVREVVILKTLGATRRRVAGIFSMEFLVLGAAAGLLGSALATGFAALVVKRLLKSEFHFGSRRRICSPSYSLRWWPSRRDGWRATGFWARSRSKCCARSEDCVQICSPAAKLDRLPRRLDSILVAITL